VRLLIDDLVRDATLSTDVSSANYPVTNVQHRFLKRRYQPSDTDATITVTFDAVSSVDCFFYSYHNLTAIAVRLYNSGDSLLHTETISSPESGAGAVYFTSVASVAYAEVDITSGASAYIGGIGLGEYLDIGRPLADFRERLIDNAAVSVSPAGQTQQVYVEPFGGDSYTVPNMSRDTLFDLREAVAAVGRANGMWIDPFYLNHSYRLPFYGRIVSPIESQKNGNTFDLPIEFQEMN